MTLTRRARLGGPVLHPRLCAAVVASSSAVHVWLAVQNHHGALLGVLMLALAAVCMPCALHIWRHSRVAALRRVMACAVFMAALHGVLLLGAGSGGHAHAGAPPSNVALQNIAGTTSAGGLLLVIALEITTALLAATLVARLRSARPHPN
ncbi:hypothetical protein [Arthrobacter sp. S39]|uniref:hypothetical protein n=1 Tax=Arthrobacter sp. S39 TaxID=2509720 RepID=UPI001037CFCE|nr:hypothetical protein [Arthrobacter sp. S39]TAP41945.1 hypothetical protein EYS21_17625 [Arthrobacter sp. S39]